MRRLLSLALLGAIALQLAAPQSTVVRAGDDKPAKAILDIKGQLTDDDPNDNKLKKPAKTHEFKLEAGKGYRIDLRSNEFDTFLRLLDPKGKEVAFNDDAEPPALDSRIIYIAPKEGMYKIVVSTFDGKTGNYSLTVTVPSKADLLQSRIQNMFRLTPTEQKQVVADYKKHLAEKGKNIGIMDLRQAMGLAMTMENARSPMAVDLYLDFSKVFAGAGDEKVVKAASQFAGAARRIGLPGKAIHVNGTTLEGKKFNWADYKGKVVLVDYWATWCGPCVAEVPNMKRMYDKFHDKGFDIVGISLDRDSEAPARFMKEKDLAWTCLFDKEQPMASYYGIFSIPQAILVGRDGNVVSLHARGAELGRLLEKLLETGEK